MINITYIMILTLFLFVFGFLLSVFSYNNFYITVFSSFFLTVSYIFCFICCIVLIMITFSKNITFNIDDKITPIQINYHVDEKKYICVCDNNKEILIKKIIINTSTEEPYILKKIKVNVGIFYKNEKNILYINEDFYNEKMKIFKINI